MTALLDAVWTNLSAVDKAALKALAARWPLRFASVAALEAAETGLVQSAEIGAVRFDADFADTTTASDGADTLVTADGVRFKRRTLLASAPNGSAWRFDLAEEEVTLSGATTDATLAIADRDLVFAVSARVTQAITGATSWDLGEPGDTARFGDDLAVALGTTNIGVIGPTAFYAAAAVRFTANGSDFTGGKVRIALARMTFEPPSS